MPPTDDQPSASGTRPLPGDRSLVGDMHVATKLVTPERSLLRAPLTAAVSSPAGSASLAMLTSVVDVSASDPALAACQPDWTATQDLSIHASGWLTEGPVVVDSRLVRVGKKVVVVAADVYDGNGIDDFDQLQTAIDTHPPSGTSGRVRLTGRSLVTFVRLPRSAASGVDDYEPGSWIGQVRLRSSGVSAEGTMYQRSGLRVLHSGAGVAELERTPYVTNSIGTIVGGGQAMLVEAAAEAIRPGLVATDLQMHFLSQVRAGPARSRATVSRDASDHSVVVVELVDAGHDHQLLALATVLLQRPPR